jgi:cytochrome b561
MFNALCDRAAQQIKAFILVGALTQLVHEFLWRRGTLKKLLNDMSA